MRRSVTLELLMSTSQMGKLKDIEGSFNGRHFDREIIILCVRWYLRYKLSFRDLAEMMAERGALVPPRAQAPHQEAALLAKSLAARLNGEALLTYRYQDFGSLISLSRYDAVGELMGSLLGDVNLSGWLARMFYVSLYRMHQVALYGLPRAALRIAGDYIGRRTSPRLKLH